MSETVRVPRDTINAMQCQIANNYVLIQALIEVLEEQGIDRQLILSRFEKLYDTKSKKVLNFFETGEYNNE